ncbi:MAG TPA: Ig-like domain-containing protein [Candidatus Paceibacterota bacterium]|nr:Ig-like domain-containing protein [Verrucomicrobiota bacterium]HRY48112.1 Ig-like domain-containing protein [Candidatus Paceibacterota bacterium]
MKNRIETLLAVAVVAGTVGTASAFPEMRLDQLLVDGASMTVEDKIFDQFGWKSTTIPAAGIIIQGIDSSNPLYNNEIGIDIRDGMTQNVRGYCMGTLTYRVRTSDGRPITEIHQTLNGSTSGEFAYAYSTESVLDEYNNYLVQLQQVIQTGWVQAPGFAWIVPSHDTLKINLEVFLYADTGSAASITDIQLTFGHNQAPMFITNPVLKADAVQDVPYLGQTLADAAFDPDPSDILTFSKIAGPAWLMVSMDGTLSGTPQFSDVGVNLFSVQATDPAGGSVKATLAITVVDAVSETELVRIRPPGLPNYDIGGEFGRVSLDGDNLIVGAWYGGSVPRGYAYIFNRNQGGLGAWGAVKRLDPQADLFGTSVAISGDTAVVGAYGEKSSGDFTGAAYVYQRDAGGANAWGMVAKLSAYDAAGKDWFGYYVAISGDTIVVSADHKTYGGKTLAGAAYVFGRNQGGLNRWGQVAKLTNPDPIASYVRFGTGVAIDGNTLIIGDIYADGIAFHGGAVYIYQNSGGSWIFSKRIAPQNLSAWETFGENLSIHGDTIAASSGLGTFVFSRDHGGPGNWGQVAAIARRGAVALSDDYLVVGGIMEVAFLYRRDASDPSLWTEVKSMRASDEGLSDLFGGYLSISGDTIAVGAPRHATVYAGDGQVYIFSTDIGAPPVEFTQDPVLKPDATEDVAYAGQTLSDSVTNPANDGSLQFSKISGPDWLVVATDGALSGTPLNADVGLNPFTVQVMDSAGAIAQATLQISVINVNDPPAFTGSPVSGDSATEDVAYSGSLAGLASDPDTGDTFAFSKVSGPAWLNIAADGSLSGTPGNDDVGLNTFTVKATDVSGASGSASLTINVVNVNDPPTFVPGPNVVVDEDSGPFEAVWAAAIKAGPADEAVQALTWVLDVNSDPGLFLVPPALSTTGVLSFTPAADANGNATVTVTLMDDGGTANGGNDTSVTSSFTIAVTPVNDPPQAITDSATTTKNLAVLVEVLANDTDVERDVLTVYSVTQGQLGGVTINPNNTITYTPASGTFGEDSFTYTISDGRGGFATTTVTVSIQNTQPTNQAPTANNDSATTANHTQVTINLIGNDIDDDGDLITLVAVGSPSNGTTTLNADGTVTYMPAGAFNGTDKFTYTITDGKAIISGTVDVQVAANIKPTATPDSATTRDTKPITIDVMDNDTDGEKDPIHIVSVSEPSSGTAILNFDGTVTFTPSLGFKGKATFNYSIADDFGGTATGTVSVTVTVNALPDAKPDKVSMTDEETSIVIDVVANDTDSDLDTLTVINVGALTEGLGTATQIDSKKVLFTPEDGFKGKAKFTYTISDGNGGFDSTNVTVTVP